MSSIGDTIFTSTKAVIKVFLIAACGAVVAKIKIFDKHGLKTFSQVYFYLFLPCLMITSIPPSVENDIILQWWPLIAIPCIYVIGGCGMGLFFAFLFRVSDRKWFIAAASGFGNTISLPLALIQTLSVNVDYLQQPGSTPAETLARGTSYILVFNLTYNLLTWTVAYNLLRKPEKLDTIPTFTNDIDGESVEGDTLATTKMLEETLSQNSISKVSQQSSVSFLSSVIQSKARTRRNSSINDVDTTYTRFTSNDGGSKKHHRKGSASTVRTMATTFRKKVSRVLNAPTWGITAGLILGVFTPVKVIFYATQANPEPLLGFIQEAFESVGIMAVPATLLILGGKMAHGCSLGDRKTKISIAIIIIIRLIIMPTFSWFIVELFDYQNLLVDDILFKLCLLINNSTPTAVNLIVICVLHESSEEAMVTVLFLSYIIGVFTLTGWIAVYLQLLAP